MKIIISNSSSVPIYEQIKQAIIKQILTGELQEGEVLPSIRTLAQEIRISVMTIKKAYDILEKDGYIKTVHGKGSFVVKKNFELFKEEKQKEIERYITEIIKISKNFNISKNEILELFEFMYGEE